MRIEVRPELKIIADALKTLQSDGIIRTKNLVGDLGEYYCKQLFDLQLQPNVTKGFDAFDLDKSKVEIKTRRTPINKTKVIFRSFDFTYCLFVELNEFFEPETILKIDVAEIIRNLDARGDRLSVGKIKKKTKNQKIYQIELFAKNSS